MPKDKRCSKNFSMIVEKIDVSIIIPCYNSGDFLLEAIQSVELYNGDYKYTTIIVDDGSTHEATIILLKELVEKGYKIIHQENKGPAAARNAGVKNATSEYILFLDSDNKILPEYIDQGITALKENPKVGVVYSKASFFGENSRGEFEAQPFDIQLMLTGNYIDMCSLVRKCVWEEVGGLDEERNLIGHEDWEFWISIYKTGWEFLYIDKVLFEYRIREGSLLTQTTLEMYSDKIKYIYQKHIDLIYEQYRLAVTDSIIYNVDRHKPFRSFAKYLRSAMLNNK